MSLVGINPDRDLVEIVEIPEHPWFVGVQFHPELQSTVNEPHPLFVSFVKHASEYASKHGIKEAWDESKTVAASD
jgi:CTP synthase